MRTSPFLIASLILLGLVPLAQAQDVPQPEDVVVTVSAEGIPASAASASITVVGREEISQCHCDNVVEILRTVPALHVSQVGSKGGMATVSIRGGEESFALIMIDGIPVNDITNLQGGAVDLSSLGPDNVDRIEIVRGPLSSLYGSEAIGGVINIISNQGTARPSFSLFGDLGSFNSVRIGGSSSGKIGIFDYSLGASFFNISEQVENDSFSLGTVSLTSGLELGSSRIVKFTLRFSDSTAEGFPANGGGPEYSIIREPKNSSSEELIFGADFQGKIGSSSFYGIGFDTFLRDEESNTPPILDAVPPSFQSVPSTLGESAFQRTRLTFTAGWQARPDLSINGSVGLKDEDGRSDYLYGEFIPSTFDVSRKTGSAAGELLYRIDRFSAHLGLRMDKSQGFSSELSPRIGLNLRLHPTSRLKVNWGEGFKLPSFYALSEPNVGNPELRPESSRGFDVGLETTFGEGRLTTGLTYFHNQFEDLIDFSPEQFRLVNRAKATTQGVEAEGGFRPHTSLEIQGHLTYLYWEVPNSTEPLRDRPNWRGGVNLTWKPASNLTLVVDTVWVGSRFDYQVPIPERNRVEAYSATNLAFTYRWLPELDVYFRAENLFDQVYQEFLGFPNPGLTLRAGIRYSYVR